MNAPTPICARQSRAGFSLIEVLIAILVLALGLLGLGAVFPAVIAQQRQSVATVEGESVASFVEGILTGSSETIDFSPWFDPNNTFGLSGTATSPADLKTYEWVITPFAPYTDYRRPPGFAGSFTGSQDGRWYIELTNAGAPVPPASPTAALTQSLTVADRLVPPPYSGRDPKYIWDIVARRQPGTNRPQLAIFIRQIDARIRVPSRVSLSDMLIVGDVPGSNATRPILPVAIDAGTGYPAVDDGRNPFVYAAPQTLQVQVVKDHLDWLVIEDASNTFIDTSISFATQPGQKLLDNTGIVRTVLGPATGPDVQDMGDTRVIRVDPPFQPSHAAVDSSAYSMTSNNPMTDAQRASWIRQIVFTPRTPLAIRILTLEEPAP